MGIHKQTTWIGLSALILMAGSTITFAQGAPPAGGPPGVGGPGMARVEKTPQEKTAIETVQNFGKLIDQGKVDEAFSMYVSKDFNDHSDMLRNMTKKQKVGYDDAAGMFKKMPEMGGGNGAPKKAFVEKITADDDMVTAQGRVGQDIYRVKDGKITDHWDTLGGFTGGPGPGGGGPPAGGAQ